MDVLRTETPLSTTVRGQEAALDWDAHGFEREPVLRLRQHVLDEIGLSISLGVAPTLLVAKMASEVAKRRARLSPSPGEAEHFSPPCHCGPWSASAQNPKRVYVAWAWKRSATSPPCPCTTSSSSSASRTAAIYTNPVAAKTTPP